MTHKNALQVALAFTSLALLFIMAPTMVWAYSGNLNENYQEVSYDDLVNELNSKKTTVAPKQKLPQQTSYIGVGYVHTYSQMSLNNNNTARSQNGLQLSGTMNLDSPNLYAEGLFRNFSGSTLANETLQVYQFDARLGYNNELVAPWKYTLFTGFVGRFIDAQNTEQNYAVNEFTPSFSAGVGAIAEIHRNLRLGFEIGGRTSILGRNTDRDSVDFAIRLDTSL
jgi:hypothetical protein